MRTWFLLTLTLAALPAFGQDAIHRCLDSDGRPLYTDQPCAALNATVAPSTKAPPPGVDATGTPPSTPAAPPPVLCAGSISALRQSMLDAFGARDPNRLAGLVVWDGAGRQTVVAHIRGFADLMRRPLIDINEEGGPSAPAAADPLEAMPGLVTVGDPPIDRSGGGQALVVHTSGDDGSGLPRETRFAIVRRSGCLWLRPPR